MVTAETARPWLASYPSSVAESISLPRETIGDLLDARASAHPKATAVVFEGYGLTWGDIRELSDRAAARLSEMGVGKGDRVFLLLPNVPHFVVCYYATVKLGAIVVAGSPLFSEKEIERFVELTDPTVIVTLDLLYDKIAAVATSQGRQVIVGSVVDLMPAPVRRLSGLVQGWNRLAGRHDVSGRLASLTLNLAASTVPQIRRLRDSPQPGVEITPTSKLTPFRRLVERRATLSGGTAATVDVEDAAVMVFTTGTTGIPKAAVLTHRNLIANAYQIRAWFPDLKEGRETIMAVLPFFHSYGLTLVMNAGLVLAARSILVPRPVLGDILQAVDRYRPTALPGVPALFVSIAGSDRASEYDLRSIRICVSGGAPLPVHVKERFESLTGAHLFEGYGLTEASPLTHAQPCDQSGPPGSIGLPVPDTDALIVDDDGNPVTQGEVGELIVRGPQVMSGYWRDPEETALVKREGWLFTGDLARMDERGFFFIVDRKKDLIITGGENIAPREIEEALYRHPSVEEAAVAGIPHEFGGQVAKAYVVLKAGATVSESELKRFLRGELAHYKVPRVIQFRDSLPKAPTGKVLRRILVEEEREKAHLGQGEVSSGG